MPQNYYRYAISRERGALKRRKNTYHGLVFSAHIASYYRKSCSELVNSLQKPYIIDPFTFVFGRDPGIIRRTERDKQKRIIKDRFGRRKKGDIKRSYSRLADGLYGKVIHDCCNSKRAVRTSDFKREEDQIDFVQSVLTFQDEVFTVSDKYKKYSKYTGRDAVDHSKPEALIAPYFYRAPSSPDWHICNLNLVKTARGLLQDDDRELWSVLCLDKSDIPNIPELAKQLSGPGLADGVWLWVNDFRDTAVSEADLRGFTEAVSQTRESGVRLGNLYSGAFSTLLYDRFLEKFSCGPCYGESRSVDQDADDAVIPDRYYFATILKKILLNNFSPTDLEEHPELLCSCDLCLNSTEIANFNEEQAREHFLQVRSEELDLYPSIDLARIASLLEENYNNYKDNPLFDSGHLKNWVSVLKAYAI